MAVGWRLWFARGRDAFGIVLIGAFAVLVIAPFELHSIRPVIVLVFSALLVFALWTSDARNSILVTVLVLAGLCLLGSVTNEVRGTERFGRIVFSAISAGLAVATIAVIVRRLGTHARVSIRTITGSLSVYLLIGLVFTYVYVLMAEIRDQAFFAQPGPHSPVAFLYFSFVTLTTVGFGDLTPADDPGRMLAVVEALVGQLYLVSVVALIIANAGRGAGWRTRDD